MPLGIIRHSADRCGEYNVGRTIERCLRGILQDTDDEADGDDLHPIQQAMHDAHGFQCAFCAPGFLMTTLALLDENPSPTSAEIRQELSGNLCRCTGYHTILDGVERAVELMAATTDGVGS